VKPPLLVATTVWEADAWADRMRALLPDRPILFQKFGDPLGGPAEKLLDVRYLLAWRPWQEIVDALPNLSVMFSLGAGVDSIMSLPRLPDCPLVRIVDPDLTARMTEYVVWQVLHHLRQGVLYAEQQRRRIWRHLDQPSAKDVTVGFMGFGEMARNAADLLLQLGFQVRAWTRSPKSHDGIDTFSGAAGLDPFLAGTDILVALLPLSPDTRGLIDGSVLRKLRPDGALGGPVLINAGRGGSQNEDDIAAALRDGTLLGATLDVFVTEPLPAESPLWDCRNLVITPHAAADSTPDALAAQIARQIEAFERGDPLRNVVDRQLGY
jgi:glyoxylate/hydroxypyruvate reductase A